MGRVQHIFVTEIGRELLEFDHMESQFHFESLVAVLMRTIRVEEISHIVLEGYPKREWTTGVGERDLVPQELP
jgi:hypothetical protein